MKALSIGKKEKKRVKYKNRNFQHFFFFFRSHTISKMRLPSYGVNKCVLCNLQRIRNHTYLGNPSGVLSSASCSNCSRRVATYWKSKIRSVDINCLGNKQFELINVMTYMYKFSLILLLRRSGKQPPQIYFSFTNTHQKILQQFEN